MVLGSARKSVIDKTLFKNYLVATTNQNLCSDPVIQLLGIVLTEIFTYIHQKIRVFKMYIAFKIIPPKVRNPDMVYLSALAQNFSQG